VLLDALVALLLGLAISALVSDAAQATIALPMVCFPAVLFAGAVLPVAQMATAGWAIAVVTPARWAYDAVGDVLDATSAGNAAQATAALALFAGAFMSISVGALRRRLA